jgi:hypothetical protein
MGAHLRCRHFPPARADRITRVILGPDGPHHAHPASSWLGMSAPRYRPVIEGELGPRYASAFDRTMLHTHHGETEITGPITDDAHLQGLIQRIAGLELRVNSSPR